MYRIDAIDEASSKEPPSFPTLPSFLVGCDGHDGWAVVEIHGLCGGLFATQDAALKYAREETGGKQGAVRLVPQLSPFQVYAR